MNPYTAERWTEELWHLQYMPGEIKRRAPETLERIAQINAELRTQIKEGVRIVGSPLPHRGS